MRISYTAQFEWMQVQAASGISPQDFDALPGNPCWVTDRLSKAHWFAWYTLRNRIEGTVNEAQMRKIDAQAAKAKYSKRGR